MKRGNGVLAHIASLPSRYGIGSLGGPARFFVDQLGASGQTYWQVTPCLHPSDDNDPYTPISAFAYNPYLIDLELLAADGLLDAGDLRKAQLEDNGKIDYKTVAPIRRALLEKAYLAGKEKHRDAFTVFKYQHAYWVFDYALYVVVKRYQEGRVLRGWTTGLLEREPEAVMEFAQAHREEIECVEFAQFLYQTQWDALRAYAGEKGILLIGEIPFYINEDCADAWVRPEMALRDGSVIAPPESGAEQHGLTPYDWEHMRRDGYQWWMARIGHWSAQFDYLLINRWGDICTYHRVPRGACAEDGEWEQGPGYDFNAALRTHMPNVGIIGGNTQREEQREFLHNCGFMQTRVMQLAFEDGGEAHMPHYYERHCLCTTSPCDGSSARSWFLKSDSHIKERLKNYFGTFGPFGSFASFGEDDVATKLMRAAMGSVADVCIVPLEDLLDLADEQKLFVPGRDENWVWRMDEGSFGPVEQSKLGTMTKTYGRFKAAGKD